MKKIDVKKAIDEMKIRNKLYSCPYCDRRFNARALKLHIQFTHGIGDKNE